MLCSIELEIKYALSIPENRLRRKQGAGESVVKFIVRARILRS